MRFLEYLKKIFSGLFDMWNFYGGIILSTLLAWLFDFNRNSMDDTTSFIILTITIISVFTIVKKDRKSNKYNKENSVVKDEKKTKEKKEKKKKEKLNMLEKTTLLNPQFKALQSALSPLESAKNLSETIIETTTLIERLGKFMKQKIVNFFKRLWGNKFTILNIILNLVVVGIADYLLFSDYLMRFEIIAQNELAFKIAVPILSVFYLIIDIFTTVSKYGWESLLELNEKSKQKAIQKASQLSKEQKEVVKNQIAIIKKKISDLELDLEHVQEIINNYQVLESLQSVMPIPQDKLVTYSQAMNDKPRIEIEISELKVNLTQLQQALK